MPAASATPPPLVRTFRPEDAAACRQLFVQGLLGRTGNANDVAIDVDDIDRWYLHQPGNHFWIAEVGGVVVGMIGVQHHDEGTGEIRRLRVRDGSDALDIAQRLLSVAIDFCAQQQYLKVTLDTHLQNQPAIELFQKAGYKRTSSRTIEGHEVHYFYADLYARPER